MQISTFVGLPGPSTSSPRGAGGRANEKLQGGTAIPIKMMIHLQSTQGGGTVCVQAM